MISRERVKRILEHREVDRVAIQDRIWQATGTRWREEGLPKGVSVQDYFGYEMTYIWVDTTPRFPVEVLHQDKKYIVRRNSYGQIVRNYTDFSSTPQVINCAIKNRKDWDKAKEKLKPDDNRLIRFSGEPEIWLGWKKALEYFRLEYKKGRFIAYSGHTGFGLLHRYIGMERLFLTIATDPEWIQDMAITQAKLLISMYEIMLKKGFRFDGIHLSNDMGGRNGLLFSPRCYREQFFPADKLICDYFRSKDMPVILHSDGDLRELIPDLIKVGFSCLEPLEVKASMDVGELKKQYGNRIALMGGIDVRLMADEDPQLIEDEIKSKFTIAKENSGYIYHSDHSIPNNVSFQRYKYVIELVKKYGRL